MFVFHSIKQHEATPPDRKATTSSANSGASEILPSIDDLSLSLIDKDIEFRGRLRSNVKPEPPTQEDHEDVKVLAGSSFAHQQLGDE